ncbi:hypothetical protein GCM10008959_18190 [Deinococcus seoulensis]|uniref:Uncharacterized protein n=1 Tax=Deinococcus seoulensis TaxID=1837379 RepID=A0ABQ2RQA4_9DEIO|nr:hypothetical protein [Deinococcus seoulensis]GGR56918.1 hypothetical protein GCM10008959_18190 [Deinococcus seoulensis]
MNPADLAQEALIWQWQILLDLHGAAADPAQPVRAWTDAWILRLTDLPDDLLDLSLHAKIMADTGIPLANLAATASWPATLPEFARRTLPLIRPRAMSYTRHFSTFYPVTRADAFPAERRQEFDAWQSQYVETFDEDQDFICFERLLQDWAALG